MFLNIAPSKYFFASCYGSYLVNAHNYFSMGNNTADPLYFLSNCKLALVPVDYCSINEFTNPWGIQPFRITNSDGVPLFQGVNLSNYFEFFKYSFNIEASIHEIGGSVDVLELINSCVKNNNVCVVNVDEFYNPNTKYFMTQHNSHGIQIRGIDINNKEYEVIDTDAVKPYRISFHNMKECVEKSIYDKELIVLSCNQFERNINNETIFRNMLGNYDASFTDGLINYMPEFISKVSSELAHKALYYSILFGISSMAHFRLDITSQFLGESTSLTARLKKISQLWRQICYIMLRDSNNTNYDFNSIQENIKRISESESETHYALKQF